MTPRVIRSDRADRDLLEIIVERAIAVSWPSAVRLARAIEKKADRYARLPHIGILRDDLADGLRCFPARPYLIYYRPLARDRGIEIVRVIHGAQNVTPDHFKP